MADGTTNTVLFSEIRAGTTVSEQDVVWGYGEAGCSAYTHQFLPNAGVATVGSGFPPDFAAAHATASSFHPGGVNIALAGTNTTFESENVDLTIWHAKGTASGGEPVLQE